MKVILFLLVVIAAIAIALSLTLRSNGIALLWACIAAVCAVKAAAIILLIL